MLELVFLFFGKVPFENAAESTVALPDKDERVTREEMRQLFAKELGRSNYLSGFAR